MPAKEASHEKDLRGTTSSRGPSRKGNGGERNPPGGKTMSAITPPGGGVIAGTGFRVIHERWVPHLSLLSVASSSVNQLPDRCSRSLTLLEGVRGDHFTAGTRGECLVNPNLLARSHRVGICRVAAKASEADRDRRSTHKSKCPTAK